MKTDLIVCFGVALPAILLDYNDLQTLQKSPFTWKSQSGTCLVGVKIGGFALENGVPVPMEGEVMFAMQRFFEITKANASVLVDKILAFLEVADPGMFVFSNSHQA
jgi:hypothetical protein